MKTQKLCVSVFKKKTQKLKLQTNQMFAISIIWFEIANQMSAFTFFFLIVMIPLSCLSRELD